MSMLHLKYYFPLEIFIKVATFASQWLTWLPLHKTELFLFAMGRKIENMIRTRRNELMLG